MANSVTIQASASGDTTLISTSPTTNFGSLTTLQIRTGKVAMVRFDLSAIPSGATVTAAKLLLTCAGSGSALDTQIHRMLQPWTEAGATWNTYNGAQNWATPGAADDTIDYYSTVLATFTWTVANDQIEITIPTPIVQAWVDGGFDNNGFRLTPTSGLEIRFHSSEAGTPAYRPLLEVTYTPDNTYKLDGTNFSRNPLTKSWRRTQLAVHGTNEPIFTDFWQIEMSFGWLTSASEMNFFEDAFLDGGPHTALLPHPQTGVLTGFTGVFIDEFSYEFNDIERNAYAVGARLVLGHISLSATGTV